MHEYFMHMLARAEDEDQITQVVRGKRWKLSGAKFSIRWLIPDEAIAGDSTG